MKYFFRILWQLPQVITGLIIFTVYYLKGKIVKDRYYKGVTVIILSKSAVIPGVSFGEIVFVREDVEKYDKWAVRHEYGHCLQSRWLGVSYLLVVGAISLFYNILSMHDEEFRKAYYQRWPETWADELGGVKREDWNKSK